MKAPIFFIAHKKFQDQNMFSLEDIGENVTNYGNHNNLAYTSHREEQVTVLYKIAP